MIIRQKHTWVLVLALVLLSMSLLACSDLDMDRSDWGWDGTQGDDSANIYAVETRAAAPAPTRPAW